MRLPRFGGSGQHHRKHTLACLAAFVAALAAAPGAAQTTGAPPTGPDSTVATPPDSAARGSAARDSATADTARVAPGDTLPRGGRDTTTRPARPAPPPPPLDSALGAACKQSAGGPPDLLTVKFRPATTEDERAAVVKEVGGTLVGASEQFAPGTWYLRVPGSAEDGSVADRLIRFPPVLEVGTASCPS